MLKPECFLSSSLTFPFISNTKIAFEPSHSFPLFLHIYIYANSCTDFPSLSTPHISETVGRPLGGCCPDSCAISWVNQLIKKTKKIQKLLKTDSCLQHCSALLYLKKHSTASMGWNKGACKSGNELLHKRQWCHFLSNANLGFTIFMLCSLKRSKMLE